MGNSAESFGDIIVELGPEKEVCRLHGMQIPVYASALDRLPDNEFGVREIWLQHVDPADFHTYLDATDRGFSGENLAHGLGWLDLVKLCVVAETMEDMMMQLKCRIGLRHKVVLVDNNADLLFTDEVVQYVYERTALGSPLRETLVEIAVNNGKLVAMLSAPAEFYHDYSNMLRSRDVVHVSLPDAFIQSISSERLQKNRFGKAKGFFPENPKETQEPKSAPAEASGSSVQFPPFLTPPFTRPQADKMTSSEPALPSSASSHSRIPSIQITPPEGDDTPSPMNERYSTPNAFYREALNLHSYSNSHVVTSSRSQPASPVPPFSPRRSFLDSPWRRTEVTSASPNSVSIMSYQT